MTALPSETKPKTNSLGISSDLEHLNCQSRQPTLFPAGMKSSEGRDGLWCLRTLAAVSRVGTRLGHSNRARGQVLLDRHWRCPRRCCVPPEETLEGPGCVACSHRKLSFLLFLLFGGVHTFTRVCVHACISAGAKVTSASL